jgi:hypothetical protein
MIANRMKPVLAALVCLLVASAASAAEWRHHAGPHGPQHGRHLVGSQFAGETLSRRHDRHVFRNDRWDRQGDAFHRRYVTRSRSDWHRRDDRYGGRYLYGAPGSEATRAGATYAYPDDGNGIYFDRGYGLGEDIGRPLAPHGPKIIRVGRDDGDPRFAASNGCSYEQGVCVIRGGR